MVANAASAEEIDRIESLVKRGVSPRSAESTIESSNTTSSPAASAARGDIAGGWEKVDGGGGVKAASQRDNVQSDLSFN